MDTFNVELPDGRVLEGIPVGTTRAQIEAKIGKVSETAEPAKPISIGAELGKVADKTLRGGALALPGMMGDAAMWASQKLQEGAATAYNRVGAKTGAYAPDAKMPDPVRMWPSDALAEMTGGPIGKPETGVGKTVAGVGETTVGTMMGAGPASKLKSLAILGAASGLGAETGAALLGDSPGVRMTGGLAGGLPVGIAQAYKGNNTAKVAREVFAGISDDELEAAIQTAAKSKTAGLDLLPNQALGRESNLDALVSALASTKEGKNTTNTLRSQPLQIQLETELLKSKLPGETRALRDINNRGQETATALIEAAKRMRTDNWKKAFDTELSAIQAGPKANLDAAIAQAKAKADELTTAKRTDAAAQATYQKDLASRQAVVDAIEAQKAAPPPIPSGIGSKQGILLDDAGRGEAASQKLLEYQAKQAQLRGQGTILDSQGNPINTAPQLPPMPGSPAMQTPGALQALEAAQRNVDGARGVLAGTTEVSAAAMTKVYDKLTRLAEANGNPAIKASLLKLREGMVTEEGYVTDATKLNELLKYSSSLTKLVNMQTTGLDAGASKYVNGIIAGLRDDFGKSFSPLRKANESYAANTEVDALKKSVIGELAGRAGAKADVNAPQGKLFSVFNAGTHPEATRSEILSMQAGLAKSDPTVFTDAAKTWLSTKISDAFEGKGARTAPNIAARLTDALGSPQQASSASQGLKDTLVGMARSEKLPDNTYLALPKFLNYVAMAVERPNTGGLTSQGINELAKSSIFGRMGQVSIMTPFRQPVIAYVERLGSNTKAELDRLLTTPEGIRMLHTLSKTSPHSDTGRKAIELFLSTDAAAQSGTELSPAVNQ